jgi:hypothetical protein
MPSNQEIYNRIVEALSKKAPTPACPMCKHNNWELGAGYVVLPASPDPVQLYMGGKVYPLAVMTCSNCGNTQLINLLTLGFKREDFPELRLKIDAGQ